MALGHRMSELQFRGRTPGMRRRVVAQTSLLFFPPPKPRPVFASCVEGRMAERAELFNLAFLQRGACRRGADSLQGMPKLE